MYPTKSIFGIGDRYHLPILLLMSSIRKDFTLNNHHSNQQMPTTPTGSCRPLAGAHHLSYRLRERLWESPVMKKGFARFFTIGLVKMARNLCQKRNMSPF